jgi:hypothetical protein
MERDRKILFLADMIYFAHLYNLHDLASHQIEEVFLEIEGLERYYHHCPVFLLEVGYHLEAEVTFVDAIRYCAGKDSLASSTLPDSVLELEVDIREHFSESICKQIQGISQALAFREQRETTYEKPYRSLSSAQLKDTRGRQNNAHKLDNPQHSPDSSAENLLQTTSLELAQVRDRCSGAGCHSPQRYWYLTSRKEIRRTTGYSWLRYQAAT